MKLRSVFTALFLVFSIALFTGMGGKPKESAPAEQEKTVQSQPLSEAGKTEATKSENKPDAKDAAGPDTKQAPKPDAKPDTNQDAKQDAAGGGTAQTSANQGDKAAAKAEPSSAEAAAHGPASIVSVDIRDYEVISLKKPIIVTFSDVMTKTTDVPVTLEDMPFTMTPQVEGEGRWLTPRSFGFFAKSPYPPGKNYKLLFKDDLKTVEGRPVRYFFSFRTRAPKLGRIQPEAFDPATAKQVIHLDFSTPVNTTALLQHLAVTDTESGEKLGVSVTGSEENDSTRTLTVDLGMYRPQITLSLLADKETDTHPLGLQEAHSIHLTIPDPASGNVEAKVENATGNPSPITMYSPYADETASGKKYARFAFSQALATHSQKEFIEVSPDLPYTFDADGQALVIREKLEPGMQVSVTLKPGLTDAAGRTLKEPLTQSLTIGDYEPAVRFAEQGNFLTPEFGSRVALNLVNIDQVTLSLKRQYDNNLPFMSLDPDPMAVNMMRDLAFKEISLKKSESNEVLRKAVDIEELAKGRRGVFMLTVRGYKMDNNASNGVEYYYANSEQRLVVLTDIGLTARSFPSGITVFASGISTGAPLADAEIRVYSSSNQLVARGHTGSDGLFVYQRNEEWDDQLQPHVVVARYGDSGQEDMTFLALEPDSSIELADPASRPYLSSGFEAFVYTPRGVFRPGESVDVKALVRDASHNAPAPFPVLFRVLSSRGLEIAKSSVLLSSEGAANYTFSLPKSAPSGHYSALVEIPGQKNKLIGEAGFNVEEFVPPRLEVSIAPSAKELTAETPLPLTLGGRYLFGAAGAGLDYELGYRVSPQAFTPEGWQEYAFGDAERVFAAQSNLKYMTGKLSGEGEAALSFKAPSDWRPASLLRVLLIGSVQEDSGRWVTKTDTVTYFPSPWMLGLKLMNERFIPGQKAAVEIAAVTPEGSPAELGPVSVELSLVQGNWHTIYKDGRYVYTWNERFIPQEKSIVEGKNGKAEFAFTPKTSGRYLVRAAAADGNIVASRRINVYADGEFMEESGSGRMDSVEMTFDKKEYRPGETARLSIKAPFTGTLLLGLEKGRQLSTRVLPLDKAHAELEIPVTEDMDPNITVTAWVVRAVRGAEREWFSHRAYGMAGLLLSKEPYALNVSPKVPERASPSAPLTIPFTITDEAGTPVEGEFSVALIDEGILSLTGFRTPDPLGFFMERRRSVGSSYDAFDALLRPEARATPLLTPGGGAAEDYHGSLSTQQIFLTAYQPVVRTDANGQGAAVFDIPEYSGKGRLMVVGSSQNRFASADASVHIARDIVAELSSPRAVAPGDSFAVPVNIFSMPQAAKTGEEAAPAPKEAHIRISATGPISLSGDLEATIALDKNTPSGVETAAPKHAPAGLPATTFGPGPALAVQGAASQPGTQAANAPATKAPEAEGPSAGASAAGGKEGSASGATTTDATAADTQGTVAQGTVAQDADTAVKADAASDAPKALQALTRRLSVQGLAGQEDGIATITLEVSVPGREDLTFSKTQEVVVRAPYPRSAATVSALVKAGGEKSLTLPGAWLPGKVKTTLLLDKSPVLSVLPALEYLREYPYGCLEQTVSRAWPYLALDSIQQALFPDAPAGNNSKAILADVVARVCAMQSPSGGFGLWPGYAHPDPWRSVAATFFLVEAKAVTPVAQTNMEAALGYMKAILATSVESFGTKQHAYTTKAYAALVLTRAGQAPLGWLQHLSEAENSMLPSGRICLAGAKAIIAGNTNALQELERNLPELGAFSLGTNPSLESDIRNHALLLLFWSELNPEAEKTTSLAAQLAQKLSAARHYTPQEAGMASLALGTYLDKSGAASKDDFTATLTMQGQEPVSVKSGKPFIHTLANAPLGNDSAAPAVNLAVSGKGTAFCLYSIRATPKNAPEPFSNGLSISREWKTPDGKPLDLASGKVKLKKGDRVIVELTVQSTSPVADVAVSDLLPGGLEIENPRLNTAAAAEGREEENAHSGMFIDQREDRLLVFFDHIGKTRKYTYSLRAVSTGSFVLPPVAADAMYDPTRRAIGKSGTVIVEE